jgi:hypothetical protein
VGEVGTGDLEGVEEETGAAGVDVVRGDASENLAEGVLDAVSTAGYGKLEPVASGLPLLRIGDGSTGVVMVVAKFFSTEGRTAATMPVGPGVPAEVVLYFAGILDPLDHLHCVFHVSYPRCLFYAKYSKQET